MSPKKRREKIEQRIKRLKELIISPHVPEARKEAYSKELHDLNCLIETIGR